MTGKYGYLGVDIFFVISGFVIPWSLYRSRYVLRDYPRFVLKRNVRLYPPYLASIAITILATNFVLVPLFHIPRMTITGRDLLWHFAYLNDLVHVPWVNVVYWTLAIEFQWYLLIGLVLPLLASRAQAGAFHFHLGHDAGLLRRLLRTDWSSTTCRFFLSASSCFSTARQIIDFRQMLGLIAVMVLAMLRMSGCAGSAGRGADRIADRRFHLPQPRHGPRRRCQLLAVSAAPAHRR